MPTNTPLSDAVTRVPTRKQLSDAMQAVVASIDHETDTVSSEAAEQVALLLDAMYAHLDALTARCEAAEGDVQRLDWLEAQSRERESLMLGWNRADGDHNEFTGESFDWPESFFAIYEDQEGQPFNTLRAAIDAARRGGGRMSERVRHPAGAPCPNCGDDMRCGERDFVHAENAFRYRCASCAYWQYGDTLNEAWLAKFAPPEAP